MTLEKIVEDFLARHRRGERPSLDEYVSLYPEMSTEIRATLPALAVMEEIGLDSGGSGLSQPPWIDPSVTRIGDYRILGEIGRGGMGIVYEAEQESLRRHVALKVLPQLTGDQSGLVRFQQEARSAARLHHTNIVPVFDVGQDGDHAYYAMQLIQGQSLDVVIKDLKRLRGQSLDISRNAHESQSHTNEHRASANHRGAHVVDSQELAEVILTGRFRPEDLSQEQDGSNSPSDSGARPASSSTSSTVSASASMSDTSTSSLSSSGRGALQFYRSVARIGLQVADALAYAHARGIVHRDIKPGNLLLDATGVVWVSDFGLAKTEDTELTQTGDILGTLRYMSPERFQHNCDARADVYSLGITLYELLVMKPAYHSANRLKLVQAIINEPLPAPRSFDPFVPLDLETVILKAIEKDPTHRYQTAMELKDDLQRFINDEPIRARRAGAIEQTRRWVRRNKRLATAMSAIFALLLTLVFTLSWTTIRQGELRQVANARGERLLLNLYLSQMNLAGQAASERFGTDTIRAKLAEWSPDIVGKDLRNWEWYYLFGISHGEQFVSEPLGNGFCWSCDLSPDGTRVVVTVNGWGVQVRDANSGQILAKRLLGSARSVDWSPNGQMIAVGRFADACTILDAESLETIRDIPLPGETETYCVKWHPNSRWFAESSERIRDEPSSNVRIHDALTGALVCTLMGSEFTATTLSWHPDGQRLAASDAERTVTWNTGETEPSIDELAEGGCSVWSPNGLVLAGKRDTGIWDVLSDKKLANSVGVESLAWAPDSTRLAAGCSDGAIRICDAELKGNSRELQGHGSTIWSLAWSDDGRRLASCGLHDETLRVWDLEKQGNSQTLSEAVGQKHCLSLSQDGNQIAASMSYGGTIYVWDLFGQRLAESTIPDVFGSFVYGPDATRLAVPRESSGIAIWNPQDDTVADIAVDDVLVDLAWHDDGRLAGLTARGELAIWNEGGEELLRFPVPKPSERFPNLAWRPDGTELATAPADGTISVWSAVNGRQVREWKSSSPVTGAIGFSHDGRYLAAPALTKMLIWDVDSGKQVIELDEVRERFHGLSWNPDGSRIAACSDVSITIWDVNSGRVALKLGTPNPLHSIHWSRDGKHVVAGGSIGIVILDASRGYALNAVD